MSSYKHGMELHLVFGGDSLSPEGENKDQVCFTSQKLFKMFSTSHFPQMWPPSIAHNWMRRRLGDTEAPVQWVKRELKVLKKKNPRDGPMKIQKGVKYNIFFKKVHLYFNQDLYQLFLKSF